MKSTTIRRSNLSKEKMAVLEALKKYKYNDADFAPNVYIRPAELNVSAKQRELDLLWRSSKIRDFNTNEKSPKLYIVAGIVAAAVLFAGITMTAVFAHNSDSSVATKGGFSLVPSSENENVAEAKNETYVVQSGDTIEKILIRFYGQYSKNSETALLQANNMTNPNKLSIGQELIIPMK